MTAALDELGQGTLFGQGELFSDGAEWAAEPGGPDLFPADRHELGPVADELGDHAAAEAAERCEVCFRRVCEPGHVRRLAGTPRPRGEVRFPVGSLVRVTGGPKQFVGCLAIVVLVESTTMRHLSLGRYGAPGFDTRVGIKGLRLEVGPDDRN